MKICLVTRHSNAAFMPLALLYIKAYLVQRVGVSLDEITVLEYPKTATVDDMVAQVLAAEPDILGMSCYVWNIRALMTLARRIKDVRPHTRVVLGGPEVGPIARSVLEAHPAVDVIVRSEGEIPFAELVMAWREGHPLETVKGVVFRDADRLVETEEAPILQDLNLLPSPHLTLSIDLAGRVACVETQRGCVFRCNFCFYNKDLSIRNRRFDLDRVKQEILFWLQQDVKEIYLMDPIFNLYADRSKDILRFIVEHNHKRIPLHAEVWAEFIDDEMARLMRDAGFHFLEVGLQTTDTATLATVERRLKLQKFLDGVACLKRYNLPWELQLIYGLPGETVRSFKQSLNFASSLDPRFLAVYRLMVLPGTELWRKAADLRLEFEPEPPYFVRSHFSMPTTDVEYGTRVVGALENLANSRTLRMLGRERGVTYADVIDAWVAWEDAQPGEETTSYRVKQFVVDFCRERRIPDDFYRGFASWEFPG